MYGSRRLLCTQTDGDDAQKKTTTYKEQDPAKVTHYLTQLAEFSDYQRVYLDETGFDCYLFRPYARSLKGQIVKAQISGKRYQRLSLVSAQVGNRLIAPMVYQKMHDFTVWVSYGNWRENWDIRYCLLRMQIQTIVN